MADSPSSGGPEGRGEEGIGTSWRDGSSANLEWSVASEPQLLEFLIDDRGGDGPFGRGDDGELDVAVGITRDEEPRNSRSLLLLRLDVTPCVAGTAESLGKLLASVLRVGKKQRIAFQHGAVDEDDPPGGAGAVAVVEADGALEDVGVVGVVAHRRVGWGNFEQVAEFGGEELVARALGAAGVGPARNEMVDGFAIHAESGWAR